MREKRAVTGRAREWQSGKGQEYLAPTFRLFCRRSFMYRAYSRSLASLLLTVAYLWGGCISCDQFYRWPGAKGHCCEERRCKKSAGRAADPAEPRQTQPVEVCQTMPLERVSTVPSLHEFTAELKSLPVAGVEHAVRFSASFKPLPSEFDTIPISPPDLTLLNASLLI